MSEKIITKQNTDHKLLDYYRNILTKVEPIYKVLGFDLDGTILDTKHNSYLTGMAAFRKLGLNECTEEEWHAAFDLENNFEKMHRTLGVPGKYYKGTNSIFSKYWAEEREKLEDETVPGIILGIEETLELIKSIKGIERMCVISVGNSKRPERLLSAHGLTRYFDDIFADSIDKTNSLKELNKNGSRAIYFSDVSFDGYACKKSGVQFGLVVDYEHGYEPKETIDRYIIEDKEVIPVDGFRNIPSALVDWVSMTC